MGLGDLDVPCPRCGEMLHVPIEADGPIRSGVGEVEFVIRPVIPDHSCPPPRSRESLPRAA